MTTTDIPKARIDPRERFDRLAAQWRRESLHLSNTTQMSMLQSYQSIIGMGEQVVPLLLEALRREPSHWFWALRAITSVDPVPAEDRGQVDRMALAWVAWGIEQGYLSP